MKQITLDLFIDNMLYLKHKDTTLYTMTNGKEDTYYNTHIS